MPRASFKQGNESNCSQVFTEFDFCGTIKITKTMTDWGIAMRMDFEIPQYVHCLMDTLRAAGHRGYLVGGSLRDLLRGGAPHDFDMTTDATPEEMLEVFKAFRVIPTGLKHGTLTVLSEGNPVEITTHRVDGAYLDARRPEQVSFTRSLEGDLSRRDFTVNAMAWNPEVGLVDLFDGRGDLARGVIRAVGDPETRFREDALRILRAFRFCAQLGFDVDPATAEGARRAADGLEQISVERIFAELCRLLEGKNAQAGLRALLEAGCEKYVFFDAHLSEIDVDINALSPKAALRLAAFLPHMDSQTATALCRRWHAPNAFAQELCAYLDAVREPMPTTPYEARRFVCRFWHGFAGAFELYALRGLDTAASAALCRKVSRDGTAVELRRLAVNGKELQEKLGVLPRRTGELLLRLQDEVFRSPEKNKRQALLAVAAEICERERDFCE
jgi:tRNA nucleotidyltransferase (CCA-adding enzyme)